MAGNIFLWTKKWLMKKKISSYFSDCKDSSNDWAKNQAFQIQEFPSVFLVAYQTKGRGQADKKWENSDLMISFLWKQSLREMNIFSSQDFVRDLKKALQKEWPDLDLFLKAPNDLYLGKGKMAGLLLEVIRQGNETALVVGLGLNVFSCPSGLNSACLANQTKNISEKSWENFLDHLFSLWFQRVKNYS